MPSPTQKRKAAIIAVRELRRDLLADGPPRRRAPFANTLTRSIESPDAKERGRQLDARVRQRLDLPAKPEPKKLSVPERQSAARTTWKREIHMPMLPKNTPGVRGPVIRK